MSDINFSFNGLNEIIEEFKEAEKRVPDLSEKVLKKGMNKAKKLSKEKTPYRDKSKKHIRDSYKILPIEYESNGMNIKMTNKSPKFHLIEKGHRIVTRSGVEKGFAAGVHMVERSMEEMEEEFPKQVEKMVKKILK
ncbi:HK97 gp10 family phage protein [Clostridium botulinum D/C]|uniref:HK97 gp10 family phage protein n=1 Tax=Clostridium botulinum TaxID=1491 RepID=UPI001E43F6CD|nr:HK97 gp10 family phage protein [Clostridium botulinum]MCD3234323.1 HK97 gp10 family phage protein [Clostridium botulinum D/C]MCD3240307.1 HK97 gp10 family phage protein [Clostridium botulinum D/C]MCD3267742.1 HK97 gp10 family phage protein [Clostridium botulinum D/C]MCD3306139.1 HK97 gp10 family phage protein [Clostridium botulinum D/C]MCD3314923.1 HK97 gp10 family phage protein [Clostridium botulinum D/C]